MAKKSTSAIKRRGLFKRFLKNGKIIEKGGINFSFVYGEKLPQSASSKRVDVDNQPFYAMGVSIVLHPHNPHIPTSHANIRLFLTEDKHQQPVWWFGGGYDLTPFYVNEQQAVNWHKQAALTVPPLWRGSVRKF